jgi:hypothetical protein
MTEPSAPRPVPGPPRPGPTPPAEEAAAPGQPPEEENPAGTEPGEGRFAELEQRAVSEHVAVFEDEHARLQHELSTIDQL